MRFSDYVDFEDFCNKNNFTPEKGLRVLDEELEKKKE
jgi:hypothetical protein